ncbi:MAG TPA: alpha/beta fold hydrolase [Ktedonobacteraceae bacterium]|nr:alpha/beta fold hydrolase [Ktedonobacteraceae bacterium]
MHQFARLLIRGLKLFGIVTLGSLIIAALVAFKQLLDTPQPLDSILPGEQRIFRWKHGHIFYTILGPENASPLVLIHAPGIGASSYEMRHIIPLLARHHRIYTLDLLGFGLSDHPNIAYSANIYAGLLCDFLSDVVKQPAPLLASGLSCLYAQAAAARTPQQCSRLIFISPPANQELAQSRLRPLLLSPLFGSLFYALLSSRPLLGQLLRFQEGSGANQLSKEDLKYRYAAAHQLEAEHAPLALMAGKLRGTDTINGLQQQPLLIIGNDNVLTPQAASTSIRIISRVGPQIHLVKPEKVVEAILNWEKQLAASKQTSSVPMLGQTEDLKAAPPVPIKDAAQKPINNHTMSTHPQEQVETSYKEEQTASLAEPLSTLPQTLVDMPEDKEPPASLPAVEDIQPEIAATLSGVEAYCLKCKKKTLMKDARKVRLKNGRPATQGFCSVCDTKQIRMGKQA